jgi:hypothetical protein
MVSDAAALPLTSVAWTCLCSSAAGSPRSPPCSCCVVEALTGAPPPWAGASAWDCSWDSWALRDASLACSKGYICIAESVLASSTCLHLYFDCMLTMVTQLGLQCEHAYKDMHCVSCSCNPTKSPHTSSPKTSTACWWCPFHHHTPICPTPDLPPRPPAQPSCRATACWRCPFHPHMPICPLLHICPAPRPLLWIESCSPPHPATPPTCTALM